MLPSRTSNSGTSPAPAPRPVAAQAPQITMSGYDVLKVRFVIRLQEKLDPAKARRMPESLMRQTARQLAEQMIEAEAARLPRHQREQLLDEVLADAFWVCPLDELFRDPAVREVLVVSPQIVLARREQGWLPTNTKLRDAEHLRTALRKLAEQGEAVGDDLPDSAIDHRLPNGFRMVVVLPPTGLDFTPTATFVRVAEPPPTTTHPALGKATPPTGGSVFRSAALPGGTASHTPLPPPPAVARPTPAPQPAPAEVAFDPKLARFRERITERIIGRLSELGVFDLSRLDVRELQKVVSAFVTEYSAAEKPGLSPGDQSRLILEIITSMRR